MEFQIREIQNVHVTGVLDFSEALYLWTDSFINWTWITSHSSKWKDFVRNRVSYIQETLPNANWKLVPGKDNPADCASRGMSPSQLKQHLMWWNGPPWLFLDYD